jgi:membrane-bound lytic murein transglycosylase A
VGRYTGQTVVPYYDRREIDDENVLAGKAEPLAWVKDPVDVFFLQIQGSGKVFLDTGQVVNVHYHGTNGRPYRAIGALLIQEQIIPKEEMSMQKIRAYLHAHPEEMAAVFNYNPSYVFFKLESEGPLGYINVLLTPGRSIALDRRIFPPAALAFIQTKKPVVDSARQIDSWTNFSRFVLNQDTGGAIRGPGRADLFWGNGPYAEIAAGHLKHTGKLYFLILKPDRPK